MDLYDHPVLRRVGGTGGIVRYNWVFYLCLGAGRSSSILYVVSGWVAIVG